MFDKNHFRFSHRFVNTIAGYLLNVLMTLSWLAAVCVAVYNFVYDRERGQEEVILSDKHNVL